MIKRLIAGTAALVLMLSSAGCTAISFSGFTGNGVAADGEMTTVDFPCGDFSKLMIKNMGGALYYTAEKSDKVTIELPQDLVQYIEVSTNDGTLTIASTERFNVNNSRQTPKIYVSTPVFEMLHVDGAIEIEEADTITADSFSLEVPGACEGKLELEVKDLNVIVHGVGALTLTGTADKASINSSGVGSIEAFGLQAKEADVRTSGVGNIEISCSDKLNAEISGVGGISYRGNPHVTPSVNGIGHLTKDD